MRNQAGSWKAVRKMLQMSMSLLQAAWISDGQKNCATGEHIIPFGTNNRSSCSNKKDKENAPAATGMVWEFPFVIYGNILGSYSVGGFFFLMNTNFAECAAIVCTGCRLCFEVWLISASNGIMMVPILDIIWCAIDASLPAVFPPRAGTQFTKLLPETWITCCVGSLSPLQAYEIIVVHISPRSRVWVLTLLKFQGQ